jgi:hypothetical protein
MKESVLKTMKAIRIAFFLLNFVFFGYTSVSYSQNIGIEEKEAINNMPLFKAWLKNTPNGGILTSVDPKFFDGSIVCYFDEEGNLRKHVSISDYPDSTSEMIACYSEDGELMYVRFYNFQPEGYSYQGIAYKTFRDDWGDTIEFRYSVQNSNMTDFENYSVQGKSNKYPAITCEWNVLSKYTHVDSLASYLRIETLQPPPGCKKVQFCTPSKNQTTNINNDNVNLRESAKTSSKVIRTMRTGEKVKILEVLQEETVRNVGTYHWYKIEVYQQTGYVFGAYLEPVEKEVK